MNKQYLLIIGGGVTIAVLFYFILITRSEAVITNENFNQLSLQNTKQAENIAKNGQMVKQLIEKLSELQQLNTLSASANKIIKQDINTSKSTELAKLSSELGLLKKQLNDLKDNKSQLNVNLPTAIEATNVGENFQTVMQTRDEKMRAEIEKMESTYEAVLQKGENDINWTSEIESKIQNLINTKDIGEDVHIQNIECRTNLCKVNLSHSDKTSLKDSVLMPAMGDATVYLNTTDSAVQGEKAYVMYISKNGKDLPPVERTQ